MTAARIDAFVKRNCAAQGLPTTVTDPATLARVAQIIAGVVPAKRNSRPRAAVSLSVSTTTPAGTAGRGFDG